MAFSASSLATTAPAALISAAASPSTASSIAAAATAESESDALADLNFIQRSLLLKQLLTPRNPVRPGFITRFELAPLLKHSLQHMHDAIPTIIAQTVAQFGTAFFSLFSVRSPRSYLYLLWPLQVYLKSALLRLALTFKSSLPLQSKTQSLQQLKF
jgi:hypothetical protein